MTRTQPAVVDESAESEIVIMPDGALYLFGITRSMLELLQDLPAADSPLQRLLERLGGAQVRSSVVVAAGPATKESQP